MWYGSAYYPEHWPEARWSTDAELMRAAGFNVVRIGEFAWNRFEPAEDQFEFGWIDRAIDILSKQGIRVVIGTPTAGPPVWLVNAEAAEDDCRQVYEDGIRWETGARSMCCPGHPRFIDRSAKAAAALGAHFADHPSIIGFQIDNEIGMYGHRCYCGHCVRMFRQWLAAKYGTIDQLNRRLGMIFGSAEFRSFDDVPLPRLRQDLHNPGLLLDSWRFFSDVYANYVRIQADAIRESGAAQPITTNVCHMFHGGGCLDETKLFEPLDIVGWDCYPSQFGSPPKSSTVGLLHAIARGFSTRHGSGHPFWMLEQQSGSPAGGVACDPRQSRLWAWQSAAHGADMILYFRWRTCRFGGEQYWRGILDHEGKANDRYRVVAQTGHEMAALSGTLSRLERRNDAAIFLDYESLASISLSSPGGGLDCRACAEKMFDAIVQMAQGCDVIFDSTDLKRYKLIAAPMLRLMDEELAARLSEFVHGGGTLVVTALTASLDRDHVAPEARPPWLLQDVLGVKQFEWSSLSQATAPPKERLGEAADAWQHLNAVGQVPVEAVNLDPASSQDENISGNPLLTGIYTCSTWCDHLHLEAAQPLARFAAGSPAADCPVLTVNRYGDGKAYYIAGMMDGRFHADLFCSLIDGAGDIQVPDGKDVEVVALRDAGKPVYFILNHESELQTVVLDGAWRDMIGNVSYRDRLVLEPYGVCLLTTGE